jgi:hypothetical protein
MEGGSVGFVDRVKAGDLLGRQALVVDVNGGERGSGLGWWE